MLNKKITRNSQNVIKKIALHLIFQGSSKAAGFAAVAVAVAVAVADSLETATVQEAYHTASFVVASSVVGNRTANPEFIPTSFADFQQLSPPITSELPFSVFQR